jgi:hypothetical protein
MKKKAKNYVHDKEKMKNKNQGFRAQQNWKQKLFS